MKLAPTRTFVKDYRKVPENIKKSLHNQLTLLLSDPSHPSLKLKKNA